MPNPSSEESLSDCDTEKVLPAQPKQWAALPPTRHSLSSSSAERPTFSATFKELCQNLENLRIRVSEISGLEVRLLSDHRSEVKQLTNENAQLRSQLQQLGVQPSVSERLKKQASFVKIDSSPDDEGLGNGPMSARAKKTSKVFVEKFNQQSRLDGRDRSSVESGRSIARLSRSQDLRGFSTDLSQAHAYLRGFSTDLSKDQGHAQSINFRTLSKFSRDFGEQPDASIPLSLHSVSVNRLHRITDISPENEVKLRGDTSLRSIGQETLASEAVSVLAFGDTSMPNDLPTYLDDIDDAPSELPGDDQTMAKKGSAHGFDVRMEWCMDDAEMVRLASKGFVENPNANAAVEQQSTIWSMHAGLEVPWHPESRTRLAWDIFAAILLIHDTIMLPLRLLELTITSAMRSIQWLIAIFWTLDVPACFLTGFFLKGRLEMRTAPVVWNYAKTWLTLDLMLVLVEWFLIASDSAGIMSSVGAMRNMRAIRFMRLMRLAKLKRLTDKFLRRINSIYALLCLRIITMLMAIIVANHAIACAWYAVGINGWVRTHVKDEDDLLLKYASSFHWSLTQFHGATDIVPESLEERVFAVLVLLVALVAFSWFLSNMTNSMITLQTVYSDRTSQNQSLLTFLRQRNVSKSLTVRIKEYVNMHQRKPTVIEEDDVLLLKILPRGLVQDLHKEMHGQLILKHPFYCHLNSFFPNFFQQLAHEGVQEVFFCTDDVIFSIGEACKLMLFTKSRLSYEAGNMRRPTIKSTNPEEILRSVRETVTSSKPLTQRAYVQGFTWVSEAAVWTVWHNCGTLIALEDACLHALSVEVFIRTCMLYEQVRLDVSAYAREFVRNLNKVEPSDLASRVNAARVLAAVVEDGRGCSTRNSSTSQSFEEQRRSSLVGKRESMVSRIASMQYLTAEVFRPKRKSMRGSMHQPDDILI